MQWGLKPTVEVSDQPGQISTLVISVKNVYMYINIPFIKLHISITVYNTITIKSLVYTTEMHNTALRLEKRDHKKWISVILQVTQVQYIWLQNGCFLMSKEGKLQQGRVATAQQLVCVQSKCNDARRKMTQTLHIYFPHHQSVHLHHPGSTITPTLFYYCRNPFFIFPLILLV